VSIGEEAEMQPNKKHWWDLGEDWWSVVIGLAVVALVWIGVIGSVPWPLFGWIK
jgi:hypothetical protein